MNTQGRALYISPSFWGSDLVGEYTTMTHTLAESCLCWMLVEHAGNLPSRAWESWRSSDTKLSREGWGKLLAYGCCWPSSTAGTWYRSCHPRCKSLMLDKLLTLRELWTGEDACNEGAYQASTPQPGSKTLSSHSVSLAFSTEKTSALPEETTIF